MHVHLTRALGLLALLGQLLAGGCSSDDGGPQTGDTGFPMLDPAIEIGTGEIEFEPVAEGDEVYVIYGPQGGYHFNASVRVQGIDHGVPDDLDAPNNPLTSFHAELDGVSLDLDGNATSYRQGIDPVPGEPGVFQMIGRRLLLSITDDAEIAGQTVRIEVTVTDANGVELHDERDIVAVPHPFND